MLPMQDLLRCPACRSPVSASPERYSCLNPVCGRQYPVVGGVPILINEDRSLFTISGIACGREDFFHRTSRSRLRWGKIFPSPTLNISAAKNLRQFGPLVTEGCRKARVLILGAGSAVIPEIEERSDIEIVRSDVCLGKTLDIVCDGHDLPFVDASVDGVVVQAVLQHVVDPGRVVAEIHRVLRPRGVVYAETAFLQHVCGGSFDYTRFTLRGHRYLFREFSEVSAGAIGGPGSVLSWALIHFLSDWCPVKGLRRLLKGVATALLFPLKYTDIMFAWCNDVTDSASGTFFLGQRRN